MKKIIILFLCLFVSFIVFIYHKDTKTLKNFMAEPTWGLLQKAQDNAQTINEAIDEAIADHEADPNAHIEAGESLETHKTQEVIDHPQGSILMDKFNAKEDYHFNDFITLVGWITAGSVGIGSWPGVTLDIIDGETEESYLYTTINVPGGYIRKNKNAQIQFTLFADTEANTYKVVIGFGAQGATINPGFGFIKDGASLKGYIKVASTITYTDELGDDMGNPHIYRAFYNSETDKVEFYIDGVLVANTSTPAGDWDVNGIPGAYAAAQGETSGVIKVVCLEFYTDLTQ